MNTIKSLGLLFISFIYFNVVAQTELAIPKFQSDLLVLRTLESIAVGPDPILTISDGTEVKFSTELLNIKGKNEFTNAKTLAIVINQLKKQGYKLISSNSGSAANGNVILTTYIFQKE